MIICGLILCPTLVPHLNQGLIHLLQGMYASGKQNRDILKNSLKDFGLNGHGEIRLVVEMIMEQSLGYAGGLGDLSHRRRVVALFIENLPCRAQDRRTRLSSPLRLATTSWFCTFDR